MNCIEKLTIADCTIADYKLRGLRTQISSAAPQTSLEYTRTAVASGSPRSRLCRMSTEVAGTPRAVASGSSTCSSPTSIVETPDTVTLVYEGPEPFEYKAGQFCTIDPHQFKVIAGDDAVSRGPQEAQGAAARVLDGLGAARAAGDHDQGRDIRVGSTKYPPLLSPVLVHHVEKGSRMMISGFTGPYHLPDNVLEKTDHLVHITAGSGSVPNWSMLKHAVKFTPAAEAHVHLLEQDLGRRHLPRRVQRLLRGARRQGAPGALPDPPGSARGRAAGHAEAAASAPTCCTS